MGTERAQALEEACANTGGRPEFRFMVSSPLERLVSRSGMVMLLVGLTTVVQAVVNGVKMNELSFSFMVPFKPGNPTDLG